MRFKRIILGIALILFFAGNFALAQELTPNDPFYSQQWYLKAFGFDQVWPNETGKSQVVIAVIDSGVDISHPDLHDNIWVNRDEILGDGLDNDHNGYIDDINGWDFLGNDNDPRPQYDLNCNEFNNCIKEAVFHGTMVAGVAAAVGNNNIGITGISWITKIMPLRVLSQNGSGSTYEVVKAIDYAIKNRADIINLSFVGDFFDKDLDDALIRAWQSGLIIVAAAGNEDFEGKQVNLDLQKRYPVCHYGLNYENIVIGVGASDQKNKLAMFSDYGSSCVDIIAPGESFFGTLVYDPIVNGFNQYYGGDFSGTSLAAPIISGLAALIKSYNPALTNAQIRDLILNNADNIDNLNPNYAGKLGNGLVAPIKVFNSLKNLQANLSYGQLIKGSNKSIFYYANDGKRYVFPDEKTYFSWYDNFNNVKKITDVELAQIPLGGNVTIRPGTYLVKIQSSLQVYAVSKGGILRAVSSESVARDIYGLDWNRKIVDISDAFFINYKIGEPINSNNGYDPFREKNEVISIDIDKGL
jgi:subtilisin family serine protease